MSSGITTPLFLVEYLFSDFVLYGRISTLYCVITNSADL